jgi:hypothetical protein
MAQTKRQAWRTAQNTQIAKHQSFATRNPCFTMKIGLLLIQLLLSITSLFAQTWALEKAFPLDPAYDNWTTDEYGQLYQWKDKHLCVQNSQSGQVLRESFMSFGEISGVFPLNGLRIVLFSESQQQLAFIDNTLQLQGAPLDLSELKFSYVSQIAKSARPDYIWLFDQYRSRIVLLNTRTLQAEQILDNCFTQEKNVVVRQFFEEATELYCLLDNGQVYRFDRNLTLIDHFEIAPKEQLFTVKNQLWISSATALKNTKTFEAVQRIEFPEGQEMLKHAFNENYYFQKAGKIYVYKLKM